MFFTKHRRTTDHEYLVAPSQINAMNFFLACRELLACSNGHPQARLQQMLGWVTV
jgi:hypothetical protein